MTIGTKSVLYGVHCFFIHPWFVAAAWWKLYGFPWDPRLWAAFFVHDIGYWGKPNMDGPEGEKHPFLGARIVGALFGEEWFWFCLLHSRYLAKKLNKQPSRLALADKLAIAIEPSWLYIPRARATGELEEYLANARKANPNRIPNTEMAIAVSVLKRGAEIGDAWMWHKGLREYMRLWVAIHSDGRADEITGERL